ncbi:MAG: hypothetical protein AB8A49_01125 [Prochlorococcus sp.]
MALPITVFAGLVALAPETPQRIRPIQSGADDSRAELPSPFRYIPNDEVYALDFDPRSVKFGLLEGWDREQEAFHDSAALAYVSGPMYERHVDDGSKEVTVPLGDLKLGQLVWRGRNRSASIQRAYLGIRHNGSVDFSYGELTPERASNYDTFIGGLHSIYNDLEAPPASYKGAYSISMGQRIRYYLPRIRMIMGLREDGRVEVLMSRDGLTLEQSKHLARSRGLVAAYMPDHASKSRFIIPGTKGFTEEDANWISGGATSFVHVPYMLRLSERRLPLKGNLMTSLTPRISGAEDCNGAIDCGQQLGGRLFDRALAGLNRLIEQGVEPIARLIWAPTPSNLSPTESQSTYQARNSDRAPLREPPITSDPLVLLEQSGTFGSPTNLEEEVPSKQELEAGHTLPPDLPPPLMLREGETLPVDPKANPKDDAIDQKLTELDSPRLIGAPPPPVLPPPPLSISDAEQIN